MQSKILLTDLKSYFYNFTVQLESTYPCNRISHRSSSYSIALESKKEKGLRDFNIFFASMATKEKKIFPLQSSFCKGKHSRAH